jgi:hypothetical protein
MDPSGDAETAELIANQNGNKRMPGFQKHFSLCSERIRGTESVICILRICCNIFCGKKSQ